jgi:hypothetical protein
MSDDREHDSLIQSGQKPGPDLRAALGEGDPGRIKLSSKPARMFATGPNSGTMP